MRSNEQIEQFESVIGCRIKNTYERRRQETRTARKYLVGAVPGDGKQLYLSEVEAPIHPEPLRSQTRR